MSVKKWTTDNHELGELIYTLQVKNTVRFVQPTLGFDAQSTISHKKDVTQENIPVYLSLSLIHI